MPAADTEPRCAAMNRAGNGSGRLMTARYYLLLGEKCNHEETRRTSSTRKAFSSCLRAFYVAGRCQAPTLRSFSTGTLEYSCRRSRPPAQERACVGGRRMSVNSGVVRAVRRAAPVHPPLLPRPHAGPGQAWVRDPALAFYPGTHGFARPPETIQSQSRPLCCSTSFVAVA